MHLKEHDGDPRDVNQVPCEHRAKFSAECGCYLGIGGLHAWNCSLRPCNRREVTE